MTPQKDLGDDASETLSGIACGCCRRRKAKCDRVLPACSVCRKHKQTCVYPSTRLKPGPKLGSCQQNRRARKRTRDNPGSCDRSPKRRGHDGDIINIEADLLAPPGKSDSRAISSSTPLLDHRRSSSPSQLPTDHGFSQPYEPISPEGTIGTGFDSSTEEYQNKIQLTSIIHPTHETNLATPDEENHGDSPNRLGDVVGVSDAFSCACSVFRLSSSAVQRLIQSYFANMTAFSIFHQPSFYVSIQSITSPTDLQALLASILSFSMRFEDCVTSCSPSETAIGDHAGNYGHGYFHHLALELIDIAMKNCLDEAPSLPLLQAIVLTTFYQLTSGVRGRAWRALGLCVRIAYEQRLHLIDANKSNDVTNDSIDKIRWCYDEERRRTWWAIWEMDVFASIIRRCPTAIDWSQNKTFLPVTDDAWFSLTYMPSCGLLQPPPDRWKALRDSGSKSQWAWFIVVNSFAHDAQHLSSQRAALKKTYLPTNPSPPSPVVDIENQITILGHSLRCLTSALPETLKYHGEHLSFTSLYPGQELSSRRLHASKYSIHIMTQLTKFMIHHHSAFAEDKSNSYDSVSQTHLDEGGLSRYLEAADEIMMAVSHSAENHIRYVNPFLASTIWLATAAQLVHKSMIPQSAKQDLVESKFEVLRQNCEQYSHFWNTPVALLENLETLDKYLPTIQQEQCTRRNKSCDMRRESTSTQKHDKARTARHISNTLHASSIGSSHISGSGHKASQVEPFQVRDTTEDTIFQLANTATVPRSVMSAVIPGVGPEMQQPLPYFDAGDGSIPLDGIIDNSILGAGWEDLDLGSGKEAALPSFLNDLLWDSYAGI